MIKGIKRSRKVCQQWTHVELINQPGVAKIEKQEVCVLNFARSATYALGRPGTDWRDVGHSYSS
jgi:hypothetical protein